MPGQEDRYMCVRRDVLSCSPKKLDHEIASEDLAGTKVVKVAKGWKTRFLLSI